MGCGGSKDNSPPKNKVQPKKENKKDNKNQRGNNTNRDNKKTPRNNNNNKEDDDDGGGVPDILRGYPAPSPPRWKKKDVFKRDEMDEVDNRARQVTIDENTTFEELGSQLTDDLRSGLQKVRAVFIWMGSQDVDRQNYPSNVSDNTPLGAMKLMSQKKQTDTAFFAQLCRGADIPCVVIRGRVKGISYEIGNDNVAKSAWNAVYVDGSWQIVHPLWSFSAVKGHNTGKWTKIESEGKGTRQKGQASEGENVRHIIETYFLPVPDEFIYMARADKPEWQLVPISWDMEKFLNVPQFRMAYFTSDYRLKSENSGTLQSENGMIEILFEERENTKAQFSYKLFFDENNSEESLPSDVDLPRTVFYETNGNKLRLIIRFHVIGIYKLDIESSHSGPLVSFRLYAKEKSDNENMFPANPPVGFGFGHTAKDNGLNSPSHTEGLVVMQKNKKETFKFKMRKITTIISKLRHNNIEPSELEKFVDQKVEGRNVTVEVNIPEDAKEGDFALQFYKESESEENNVLNYLLTSNKEDFESAKGQVRKRIREDRARMHLRLALDDDDIGYLERSIATFEREKLTDTDGDLKKAKQKLAKLKRESKEKQNVAELKRNLRKAMKERNLDDLEAAIEEAEDSGYPELERLIDKAKDLAHELEDNELENEQEKYLKKLMKEAIEERKKEGLEEAISEYNSTWKNRWNEEEEEQPWKKTPRKKKRKSSLEEEYDRARELLVKLYEDEAEEAISEDDCFGLQTVIDESETSAVSRELGESEVMERARRYLQQEKRLRRYLSPILALKKSTVAEIYTYRDPMPVTHDVMKATLITLGDQPREITNWKEIQRYLNPSGSILRRIKGFKIEMLRYRSADRAERLLINYTTNDVREASAGVAAFYQWSNNMIEEAKQNGSEADDDEKDRKSEEKEKKKEKKNGKQGSDRRSDNGSKGVKGKSRKGEAPKREEKDPAKRKKEKNTAYKGNTRERKTSKNEREDKDKNEDKSARDKKEEKTPRKNEKKDDSPRREDDKRGDRSSREEKEKKDEKTPRKKNESPGKEEDKTEEKSNREDKEQTPRKTENQKKDDKDKRDTRPTKDDKEKAKVSKEKSVHKGHTEDNDAKEKKDEKATKDKGKQNGRTAVKKDSKSSRDDESSPDDKDKKTTGGVKTKRRGIRTSSDKNS